MSDDSGSGAPEAGAESGPGAPEASPDAGNAQAARVAELTREAASYRTQRNAALRRAHALETIARAHNLDLTPVTDDAVNALPIHNGAVDGAFAYKPPTPAAHTQRPAPRAVEPSESGTLTREAIEAMSHAEINRRWSDIKEFLRRQ